MADELVYTSAQRGLKSGSRGFCIVAATANLSPKTVTLLESMSAYRHLNLPTGDPHPDNPVAWSHLHLPRDGSSILSRVADSGLDYSGRTNKLAHHLVLSPADRGPAGPAAMLSAKDNLMHLWSGEPRTLDARTLSPGHSPTGSCQHWQTVTGDAGWAGELAKGGSNQSRTLVVTPQTDALALVAESMSLVPPGQRWQIAFTTFDNGIPQGVGCHWRFVIAGSPEHQKMQSSNPSGLLDLTSPLGMAPDSREAQMARSGDRTDRTEVVAVPSAPIARRSATPASETKSAPPASLLTVPDQDEFSLAPVSAKEKQATIEIVSNAPPSLESDLTGSSSRMFLWFGLAMAAMLFLFAGLGVAAWLWIGSIDSTAARKKPRSLDGMLEAGNDEDLVMSDASKSEVEKQLKKREAEEAEAARIQQEKEESRKRQEVAKELADKKAREKAEADKRANEKKKAQETKKSTVKKAKATSVAIPKKAVSPPPIRKSKATVYRASDHQISIKNVKTVRLIIRDEDSFVSTRKWFKSDGENNEFLEETRSNTAKQTADALGGLAGGESKLTKSAKELIKMLSSETLLELGTTDDKRVILFQLSEQKLQLKCDGSMESRLGEWKELGEKTSEFSIATPPLVSTLKTVAKSGGDTETPLPSTSWDEDKRRLAVEIDNPLLVKGTATVKRSLRLFVSTQQSKNESSFTATLEGRIVRFVESQEDNTFEIKKQVNEALVQPLRRENKRTKKSFIVERVATKQVVPVQIDGEEYLLSFPKETVLQEVQIKIDRLPGTWTLTPSRSPEAGAL
jgi:hypothetical protein